MKDISIRTHFNFSINVRYLPYNANNFTRVISLVLLSSKASKSGSIRSVGGWEDDIVHLICLENHKVQEIGGCPAACKRKSFNAHIKVDETIC